MKEAKEHRRNASGKRCIQKMKNKKQRDEHRPERMVYNTMHVCVCFLLSHLRTGIPVMVAPKKAIKPSYKLCPQLTYVINSMQSQSFVNNCWTLTSIPWLNLSSVNDSYINKSNITKARPNRPHIIHFAISPYAHTNAS